MDNLRGDENDEVTRRIGGLETLHTFLKHFWKVTRRIGGLEKSLDEERTKIEVTRRIGGLEKERAYAAFFGRVTRRIGGLEMIFMLSMALVLRYPPHRRLRKKHIRGFFVRVLLPAA